MRLPISPASTRLVGEHREVGAGAGGHQVEEAAVDLDDDHPHPAVAVRDLAGDGRRQALQPGAGGGEAVGGVRVAAVPGDAQAVGGEHHDLLDAAGRRRPDP